MTPNTPTTNTNPRPPGAAHHVCPWWLGYVLASPIRRLFESPERLLAPFVRTGMTVVEPGCGMGYFSIPLARIVGPTGRVVCVDLQEKMIEGLRRRARRAGVADRIEARTCSGDGLGLAEIRGAADLAVAIHVLHEVADQGQLLAEMSEALKPGGTCLVLEPRGHVTDAEFARTLALAERAGLHQGSTPAARRSLFAVLVKKVEAR